MRTLPACIAAVLIAFACITLMGAAFASPTVALGQTIETPAPDRVIKERTSYFTRSTLTLADGQLVDEYIIDGPPAPPLRYAPERVPVALPRPDLDLGINALTTPAYNWVFGCSSVSGAMILGYYDRNGYPNMYTGPTNGGVAPLDNSAWPTWVDGVGRIYPNLPLAASHQGVDGWSLRGSIDDYWVAYASAAPDPYVTGGWTQHAWSDAIGDYMGTSQSAIGNTDGATTFYNYTYSASALTCAAMVAGGVHERDGTYGRKLFYEARGYTVTECYNQKTDNNGGGFTFAMYRTEIDAGRPVMLNVQGHTMVGVGYDAATSTVYLHDTWDYGTHTMPWGGSYQNMPLMSVSVVNLEAPSSTCYMLTASASPPGGGEVNASPAPNCNSGTQYTTDTQVELTALPVAGYSFAGWSGDASGTANPTSVTMNGNKTVTASFTADPVCYTLTTSANPAGGGTVSASPAPNCNSGTQYALGTIVQLTAAPAAGYSFAGWSGAVSGTSNPTPLTMNGNKSVSANFNANPICYTLTTTASPPGSGSVSASPPPNCSDGLRYVSDTQVELSAAPAAGYSFSGWSGGLTGSANPASLTMNGDRSVSATFAASPGARRVYLPLLFR